MANSESSLFSIFDNAALNISYSKYVLINRDNSKFLNKQLTLQELEQTPNAKLYLNNKNNAAPNLTQ
jgi:hypothetical protein